MTCGSTTCASCPGSLEWPSWRAPESNFGSNRGRVSILFVMKPSRFAIACLLVALLDCRPMGAGTPAAPAANGSAPRSSYPPGSWLALDRDTAAPTPAELGLKDAVLGAKLAVETPTGRVAVNVPAWSSSDKVLRLKGRGLPEKTGGHGNLYAHVRVMLPEGGDPELEALMRKH